MIHCSSVGPMIHDQLCINLTCVFVMYVVLLKDGVKSWPNKFSVKYVFIQFKASDYIVLTLVFLLKGY